MDVSLSGMALLVLSPVLLALALLVWWANGRPVLHRDTRLGKGEQRFDQLKYRTMIEGAGDDSSVAAEDDRRIFRCGRWLRRWRLDELAQLLNVIVGQMSLVGPRPIQPNQVNALSARQREILFSVSPGLVDPVAADFLAEDEVLSGRDEAERLYLDVILPAKAAAQVAYIQTRTWLTDAYALVRMPFILWSPQHRCRSAQRLRRLLAEQSG
nr:sugar transferase [Wenzhouxiangella limi]